MTEKSLTEKNRGACRLRALLLVAAPVIAAAAYALVTRTTSPAFYVNSVVVLGVWSFLALHLAAPREDDAAPADHHAYAEHARTWVTRHGYTFEGGEDGFTLTPKNRLLKFFVGRLAVSLDEPCHAELVGSPLLTRLALAHGLKTAADLVVCSRRDCEPCARRRHDTAFGRARAEQRYA